MARRTSLISSKQISEINMTPLMDLTFILLITFIITFPLIEQGVAIKLPKGKETKANAVESRNVSLGLDKQLYLDDVAVTKGQLVVSLGEIAVNEPNATIYIRADKALLYGDVMEIMRMINEAGITKTALVTVAE